MKVALAGHGQMGHEVDAVLRERGHSPVGVLRGTGFPPGCVVGIDFSRGRLKNKESREAINAIEGLDAEGKKTREAALLHLDILDQLARFQNLKGPDPALRIEVGGVFAKMKKGAYLINCSRGGIVDESALYEALKSGHLGGAALDVFEKEPCGMLPLFELDNVLASPHIGASTEQAQIAIAREVSRIVRAFLTEEDVPHVVNVCTNTPARYALVMRARDEVGVLANALSVIKRHGLNIEEISNTVFEGAAAACTKLRLSGRPTERCLQEIRAFDEVFHVDVVQLPNLA